MSKGKKIVIVIVDDKQDLADMYATSLRHNGFEVKAQVGSKGALDLILQVKPDLVLSDMVMPGVGGVELIAELDNKMKSNRPPVVILTSMSSDTDKMYALEKGAADFWNKSEIDVDSIVTKVSEFMDTRAKK